MVKLIVTDRRSIERGIVVRSSYVVISIHDPDKPRPRIPKRAGLRDVLYLAFDDAEPAEALELPPEIVLMTDDHARQIWAFVQRNIDRIGAIVCQCEQGMSRSPAVAAALSIPIGSNTGVFFKNHQPSSFVYRLMTEARPRLGV